MNVGIICYASVGGSGVVATELGKMLARRGHDVHLISTDMPFRLGEFQAGLAFHQVLMPGYPLFREPQYLLALANTVVQVSRECRLDIIHAHYAVPHATAAFLAQQVLRADGMAPAVITTLHGTDITLVGSDPSYSDIVAFSIDRSDGVTAVSESLRSSTCRDMKVTPDIRVIPNFIDGSVQRRLDVPGLRDRFTRGDSGTSVVIHVSNFRPVKRIDAVLAVFDRIRRRVPARLLLVGDGPELAPARRMAHAMGIESLLDIVGEQEEVLSLLSASDVFLCPSAQESFGLAALEAMACEVPVVASDVGGLPEVIEHGVTGFIHPLDAIDDMADSATVLLADPERRRTMGTAARRRAIERFDAQRIVPMYEAYYAEILARRSA